MMENKSIEETLRSLVAEVVRGGGTRRWRPAAADTEEHGIALFTELARNVALTHGCSDYNASAVSRGIRALVDWAWCFEGPDVHSFSKGIMLKGPTGCGKTVLMRTFQQFLRLCPQKIVVNGSASMLTLGFISAYKLSGQYAKSDCGYDMLRTYADIPVLCIDDIGSESDKSNSFGNSENVVSRIFDMREEKNLPTFTTTNLDVFSKSYDERVVSRMCSLFQVVSFGTKVDFRRNNS